MKRCSTSIKYRQGSQAEEEERGGRSRERRCHCRFHQNQLGFSAWVSGCSVQAAALKYLPVEWKIAIYLPASFTSRLNPPCSSDFCCFFCSHINFPSGYASLFFVGFFFANFNNLLNDTWKWQLTRSMTLVLHQHQELEPGWWRRWCCRCCCWAMYLDKLTHCCRDIEMLATLIYLWQLKVFLPRLSRFFSRLVTAQSVPELCHGSCDFN